MAVARYYKTLWLPSLQGQYRLWTKDFVKLAGKVDEVVSLGNLVGLSARMKGSQHRSPNTALLNYVRVWRYSFERWTQVIGPNEIVALNFPDDHTNLEAIRLLRRQWLMPRAEEAGYSTAAANKTRLVTHGGLTYGEWVTLGRPQTAEAAAALLNEKYDGTLYQGECYNLTGVPSHWANPIFADTLKEVYPSWLVAPEPCPFGQVTGGLGLNTPEGYKSLEAYGSPLHSLEAVRFTPWGSLVEIKGVPFFAVTPAVPDGEIVDHLPKPGQVYLEKVPVLDLRDDLFAQGKKASPNP